jgi:hypothetical protein
MNKKSLLFSIVILGTTCVLGSFVAEAYNIDLSDAEIDMGVHESIPNLLFNNEKTLQTNLSKQILANKTQISQLKQQLKRLKKTLQLTIAQRNAQEYSFQPKEVEQNVIISIMEEEFVEGRQFADHTANYMASEVNNYEDDQESSSRIEQNFEAELESGEITGVSLFSSECKETLCKIELGFDNEATLERYADIVISIVPWDGPAFFHPGKSEINTLIYYVAKEGFELPMPEPSDS